jgi:hypothetical protein
MHFSKAAPTLHIFLEKHYASVRNHIFIHRRCRGHIGIWRNRWRFGWYGQDFIRYLPDPFRRFGDHAQHAKNLNHSFFTIYERTFSWPITH